MSMTFIKSRKRYEKRNLTFCPATCVGVSCGWYKISTMIDGKIILNTYPYSRTTIRHVYSIKALLKTLQLNVYAQVCAPAGLNNHTMILKYYADEISKHQDKINAKRSRASKNQERIKIISFLQKELNIYLNLYNAADLSREIDSILQE
jgi:hypothetical protein